MKHTFKVLALVAALAAMGWYHGAEAAFFGMPRGLKDHATRLQADVPALAPMAHARHCLQYPDECKVRRIVFRGGPLKLTPERRAELARVNSEVNRSIRPEANPGGVATERWLIAPATGDCNDYAVTKRHALIARGWPARNLLLAEVVVPSGEHHLVLVVRTSEGDLVADNLSPSIKPWTAPRYGWVRMQSSTNPLFWMKVARASA
jgi:predicted transglutaminase-like cysteine proteinase